MYSKSYLKKDMNSTSILVVKVLQVINDNVEGIITSWGWRWICEVQQHSLVVDLH